MNWHDRFKEMKSGLGLTNSDISDITGNTPDSIKSTTQPNKEIPRWLKLAIVVFERMRDVSSNGGNCPIEEILKKWALIILSYGTSSEPSVIGQFSEEEGVMPIDGSHGVQLTYCETFQFDDDELEVTVTNTEEE